MKAKLLSWARKVLPGDVRRTIVRWGRWPPVGMVWVIGLRRRTPISSIWGLDRGDPVDRYYIGAFIGQHAADVRGHVLEIGTDRYLREFGGTRVTSYDVLHVSEDRKPITIIGDLTDGRNLESDAYDCVILTQTLNAIYDVGAAIRTVHRILKPGGVALATVPGISKVSRYDMDRWGYYWSFTTDSARTLFEEVFEPSGVAVDSRGNVSAAVAFLHGLSRSEVSRRVLDETDPDYQLVITVRAEKVRTSPEEGTPPIGA